jgi:hypothetical protein
MSLTSSSSTLATNAAGAVSAVAQVQTDLAAAYSGASGNKRGGLGELKNQLTTAAQDLAVATQRCRAIADMGASLDAAS